MKIKKLLYSVPLISLFLFSCNQNKPKPTPISEDVLLSISIVENAYKRSYAIGERMSYVGLSLIANYSKTGSTALSVASCICSIDTKYIFTAEDAKTTNHKVTLSYFSKEVSYDIIVRDSTVINKTDFIFTYENYYENYKKLVNNKDLPAQTYISGKGDEYLKTDLFDIEYYEDESGGYITVPYGYSETTIDIIGRDVTDIRGLINSYNNVQFYSNGNDVTGVDAGITFASFSDPECTRCTHFYRFDNFTRVVDLLDSFALYEQDDVTFDLSLASPIVKEASYAEIEVDSEIKYYLGECFDPHDAKTAVVWNESSYRQDYYNICNSSISLLANFDDPKKGFTTDLSPYHIFTMDEYGIKTINTLFVDASGKDHYSHYEISIVRPNQSIKDIFYEKYDEYYQYFIDNFFHPSINLASLYDNSFNNNGAKYFREDLDSKIKYSSSGLIGYIDILNGGLLKSINVTMSMNINGFNEFVTYHQFENTYYYYYEKENLISFVGTNGNKYQHYEILINSYGYISSLLIIENGVGHSFIFSF